MSLLNIQSLSKSFDGVRALDNLTLDIPEGQITGIIGPNGSGKTTLFNVISGLLKPDGGAISLANERITGLSPHRIARAGIGRTFQVIRLCGQMSVLENVMLAAPSRVGDRIGTAMLRTSAATREDQFNRNRALELLTLVGIAHKRDAMGSELSHGQRRLTEIARALALDPEVLLLDEPMSGLSPQAIEQMKVIIRRLDSDGKTILFIEHNMHVVMDLSEHVVVLNHGRKIAEGSPDEIRSNPDVITAYLGRSAGSAS
jgi:branched-chain amino acid transport system ATP-binding protein